MHFVNRIAESRARHAVFARMLARGTLGPCRINDTLWVLASSGGVGRVAHDLADRASPTNHLTAPPFDRASAGRVTDAIQSNGHRVREHRSH